VNEELTFEDLMNTIWDHNDASNIGCYRVVKTKRVEEEKEVDGEKKTISKDKIVFDKTFSIHRHLWQVKNESRSPIRCCAGEGWIEYYVRKSDLIAEEKMAEVKAAHEALVKKAVDKTNEINLAKKEGEKIVEPDIPEIAPGIFNDVLVRDLSGAAVIHKEFLHDIQINILSQEGELIVTLKKEK